MNDDLDSGSAASTDPIADAEFANPTSEMTAARVSGEALPGFAFYVLDPQAASLNYRLDDRGAPIARIRWLIKDGPEETVGQSLFTDLRLYVSKQKYTEDKDENGRAVTIPKTAAEFAEDIKKFQADLNRVA